MIQLKNVSKYYYSKGMISSGISKVDLTLEIGEFVVITGESGSGKTTLLNVISGLDSYKEGGDVHRRDGNKPLPGIGF